jgi:hypothetical protein
VCHAHTCVPCVHLALWRAQQRACTTPVSQGSTNPPLQGCGLRESVSVLPTCFSQLGKRDLIPWFFGWYKTYRCSLLASTCKSISANFGKRWIELDPNVCERRGACGCLDLYCNVDLDLRIRTQSNLSKS